MKALTLEIAKTLIGKEIKTFYSGYAGQNGQDQFVVGSIKSQLEIAESKPYYNDNFKNYAEYWKSFMTPEKLKEAKSTLELVTTDGRNTAIRCHSYFQDIFTCSDIDRVVTFEVVTND